MRIRPIVAVAATLSALALAPALAAAQEAPTYTRADTLRGTNGPARAWWDVTFYDLQVSVSPESRSVEGRTGITYRVLDAADEMQIDLQEPLVADRVVQDGATETPSSWSW
jgi:hypothetical protein